MLILFYFGCVMLIYSRLGQLETSPPCLQFQNHHASTNVRLWNWITSKRRILLHLTHQLYKGLTTSRTGSVLQKRWNQIVSDFCSSYQFLFLFNFILTTLQLYLGLLLMIQHSSKIFAHRTLNTLTMLYSNNCQLQILTILLSGHGRLQTYLFRVHLFP